MMLRPLSFSPDLTAWRTKDALGQSCASCHAPDGIDVAAFSQSDIVRRIARHHTGGVADQIREMFASSPKAEATELRPMQPGEKVLDGATPQERDEAFLVSLSHDVPDLFSPVQTLADAEKFQRTILNIDLRNLPIGIQMNRLSEDGAHGADHAIIADWFPDVLTFDIDAVRPEADAYLANPTEETLAQLDRKVVASTKVDSPIKALALAKYRSLLVYQHELRTGKPCRFLPEGNPYWQVGDFGRVYAYADGQSIAAPASVMTAKNLAITFGAQLKTMRVPWFWLGWIHDPSITHSGPIRETIRGDYFCKYLEEDGPYMGHEVFMLTRKQAEQSRSPITPNHPWEIQYSFFLANDPLITREPKRPTARHLFRVFSKNSFMMSLLLLEKDLRAKKRTIRPVPQQSQIKFLAEYLTAIGAPEKALVDRVSKLLAATPDR